MIIEIVFVLGLLLFSVGSCFAGVADEPAQAVNTPQIQEKEAPEVSSSPTAPSVAVESQEEAPEVSSPPQAPSVKLPNQQLTDQKLETLIQQGLFHQDIAEVELPGNQITGAGLEAILATPIRSLQVLNLYGNQIGDEGAKLLGQSEKVRGVNRLDVSDNGITLEGIKALFGQDSKLTGPIWIDVAGNEIGDEGVSVILDNAYIDHLQGLSVRRTGLTDVGAQAIAKAAARMKLQYLDVSGNNLTDAGRAALTDSPHLKQTDILFE